jgi:hypothetical protein
MVRSYLGATCALLSLITLGDCESPGLDSQYTWVEPGEQEWLAPTAFLGGDEVAGREMKSTDLRSDHEGMNGNGSNESGFNGSLAVAATRMTVSISSESAADGGPPRRETASLPVSEG